MFESLEETLEKVTYYLPLQVYCAHASRIELVDVSWVTVFFDAKKKNLVLTILCLILLNLLRGSSNKWFYKKLVFDYQIIKFNDGFSRCKKVDKFVWI